MSFWIVLKNGAGATKKVRPGENFEAPWEPTGEIENDGGQTLDQEYTDASQLVAEIDHELALEGYGKGDWIKTFSAPVAMLLGQEHCMGCEVRRVVINAAKTLKAKYGRQEGKRLAKDMLRRSFTEPAVKILVELKTLLEN